MKLVPRRKYLNELVYAMGNGRVKVITGVRRCGKTVLLFDLFREHLRSIGIDDAHVIEIHLDDRAFASLRNPDALYDHILQNTIDKNTHYVLIDEVQETISADEFRDIRYAHPAFYGVMNGLLARGNLDVFVTGSNSRFLSTDIMTEFADRGTEIRIHPFSFAEFVDAKGGSPRDLLEEYLMYGGMPSAVFEEDETHRRRYLRSLFDGTYRRDIIQRYNIKKTSEMDAIIMFLASNIGSLTSASNIAASMKAAGSSISSTTVIEYLSQLSETFVIDATAQAELRGKELLRPRAKYYFEDVGLRNALLGFPRLERGHVLENVVYNQLKYLQDDVKVGRVTRRETVQGKRELTHLECDFVAQGAEGFSYIQVTWSLESDGVYERETQPFKAIQDSWPKVLVVGDEHGRFVEHDGIIVIGAVDFLMSDTTD